MNSCEYVPLVLSTESHTQYFNIYLLILVSCFFFFQKHVFSLTWSLFEILKMYTRAQGKLQFLVSLSFSLVKKLYTFMKINFVEHFSKLFMCSFPHTIQTFCKFFNAVFIFLSY